MLLKIGQSSDHGFDEPLGLLSDCHRRIERFLGVLATIAEACEGQSLAHAEREALRAALHYFRSAAPRHTADEEESLFPRLKRSHDAGVGEALATLDRLEADHRDADARHQQVDALAARWLESGVLPAPDAAALIDHLRALQGLYAAHIAVEDQQLFPAARRILPAGDLEAIGREMAGRRGVPFTPPL